ncbi:MAG: hypothetical protein IJJ06_06335 [Mogibacterium sp.]|nr:hypothetical protein [Mogibacterium sp.]
MKYIIGALIVGYFVFVIIGIRMGNRTSDVIRMSFEGFRTAGTLMVILLLIGMLTGSWRSAGSIITFVYYGIQLIRPRLFLIIAFLLTCLMSYALGTSFGVAGTAGVIFITLARSGNVDPTITAGVLLSGIYFGDRTSPASSTAFTVASVTGTDLYENVRGMLRTGLIPWLLCLAVYTFLSWKNPLAAVDPSAVAAFESSFAISGWTLLPAAVILIFPLIHVPILITLLSSIAAAAAVSILVQHTSVSELVHTLFLGYHSANPELSAIIDGGGVISMLGTVTIVAIACSYTGIMNGTGMIENLRCIVSRLERKIGLFPCVITISFLSACVFCNQVVGIIMSSELMKDCYEAKGKIPFELAMDIENASITIPALVPWCILITVPLSIFGVSHAAIPFAIYIYAIPLVNLIIKILRRDV